MQPHINPLQDIIRKIIRQVMDWAEPRFKRITMSHDASNNPAELVGRDGIICYRKAGGSCAELGSGAGDSLWEQETIDGNAGIIAKVARPTIIENLWIENQGAGADSTLTFWTVYGGGGGSHPHNIID